jgi:hypothetical protein
LISSEPVVLTSGSTGCRCGVHGHAEAVADAVGVDLLDALADLVADRRAEPEERVVARRRAIVVERRIP